MSDIDDGCVVVHAVDDEMGELENGETIEEPKEQMSDDDSDSDDDDIHVELRKIYLKN